MKTLLRLLVVLLLLVLFTSHITAQPLIPFDGCPGVSVAITRPGLNATISPFQIYLIDSMGNVLPQGNPINLQINGLGLNTADGFLYGIQSSTNVANPFLTRVDKNGNFENVGTLLAPHTGAFQTGIINTAAGTMDDKDNFYFMALAINLQNVAELPQLFVGKVEKVSKLEKSGQPVTVNYTKIDAGTCVGDLLSALLNPLEGALQDIAFDPANGNIYTYIPGPGTTARPGRIAWFNPSGSPAFTCIDAPQPNIPTNDLSGLFFGQDGMLFMLTTDGKYYQGNVNTGVISLVGQSGLPLSSGNLRGDMASCVGKKALVAFDNCPGVSVAVTRPGINATDSPFQIYLINETGTVQASGNPIHLQINGFGLNSKDGFLYGIHESSNTTDPFFSRVDKNGSFVDLGKFTPPTAAGSAVAIINTAAGTMDGDDNFYFTAIVADTPLSPTKLPQLFLGTIQNVSKLKEGGVVAIDYKEVRIGTCADEIIKVLSNPSNGLLQDLSFDPVNERIYTIIPTQAAGPSPAKIAFFKPRSKAPVLNCIDVPQPNVAITDLAGLYSDKEGRLFILTIDGKFYRGNVHTGVISPVAQTALPLLAGNLRGDMASCVGKTEKDKDDDEDDHPGRGDAAFRVTPNPVTAGQILLSVNSDVNTRVQLQILGPTGSPVLNKELTLVAGANQVPVDVSRLYKGLYSATLIYPSGKRVSVKFLRL